MWCAIGYTLAATGLYVLTYNGLIVLPKITKAITVGGLGLTAFSNGKAFYTYHTSINDIKRF